MLYPLHSPGCDGNPETICAPHPIDITYMFDHPEVLLATFSIALLVGLIGRWRSRKTNKSETDQ